MADQGARLPGGGRVDHDDRRRFTFDGRAYTGLGGDTLASALLANGVHRAGRSFKLHRPRGVLCAGVEEPNALVTLRAGARREPNVQATMAELFDGLAAVSQNRWPSLGLDAGALAGLLSRFLPAGFYYKTFMGPTRGAWMWYEPAICHAAGLGRPPRAPDPDRYEGAHAFCDVLVVGAGAAGLAAAAAAGRSGARVLLLEQQPLAGGRLLSEPAGGDADAWRSARLDELHGLANVRLLARMTAFGVYDGNVVGALERAWDHVAIPPSGQPRQRSWALHAGHIVLATGATERPLLFAGNDRPGVMLAEAVRRYLNHYGVLPGRRAIVYTNNDSAYATARDLHAAGAAVTVIDTRAGARGAVIEAARADGIAVRTGCRLESAHGRRRVASVRIAGRGRGEELGCDLVCVAGAGHRMSISPRTSATGPPTAPISAPSCPAPCRRHNPRPARSRARSPPTPPRPRAGARASPPPA